MEGSFSVKYDAFSFGVLILEIVSGRRNNSFYNIDRPLNLIGYVSYYRQKLLSFLLDCANIHSKEEHAIELMNVFTLQAWELWKGGHVSGLKDPTFKAKGIDVEKQLSRTIHIGLL